MQHLGNLSPARGSHRSRKRIGRGPGSGTGKTAGRGHTGQKARKSGGVRPGFEGGQTPLYRRVPKRGFNAPAKTPQVTLNLGHLKRFEAGTLITPTVLKDAGLCRGHRVKIKILGGESLDRALTVAVHALSASAHKAIEEAGGTVKSLSEVIETSPKANSPEPINNPEPQSSSSSETTTTPQDPSSSE